MILIITSELDYSTLTVIDWLNHMQVPWIRINEVDPIKLSFNGNDIEFELDSTSFFLSKIQAVWYRRGTLNLKFVSVDNRDIDDFLKTELIKIREYIYYKFSKLPNINRFENSDVNKLVVNEIANEEGLIIPKEYLFSKKENLADLLNKTNQGFATKSVSGYGMIHSKEVRYDILTQKIGDISKVNETFFPSLVQEYIEKRYELRIFYLDGRFWSMAIFSQNDDSTSVDFRNYNDDKPNRNVPFLLPYQIQQKLIKLMNRLDLNSGSIDMIVTPNLDYVFLEVNPVGQFGMVSHPCNYSLHREIAEHLKNISNE